MSFSALIVSVPFSQWAVIFPVGKPVRGLHRSGVSFSTGLLFAVLSYLTV